jgi:adenylosuccinate lyase
MASRRGRSTPIGTAVIQELHAEVEQLRGRVAVLEEEVKALRGLMPEEVIVLRTVSREQAKQEIQELFQTGETLYYSDIARRMQLDLPMVVELCQELEQEGEIEVDADAV